MIAPRESVHQESLNKNHYKLCHIVCSGFFFDSSLVSKENDFSYRVPKNTYLLHN